MTDYNKMLKNIPAGIKRRVERFAHVAYVKGVTGYLIDAYSPIFKDISVSANSGTMGCQRGDTIVIKFKPGTHYFELVENLTLKKEIALFEDSVMRYDWTSQERKDFREWRNAQLKQKKQR